MQWLERRTDFLREQLRLLPGGEVSAPVDLVEVDEVGVRQLRPATRCLVLLARKDRDGNWDFDALCVEEPAPVLPVEARRRDAGVRQPVERDVVEDLVTRQLPGGALGPLERGNDRGSRLAVGIVVVQEPRR